MQQTEQKIASAEEVKKAVSADLKQQHIGYKEVGEILYMRRSSVANIMADKQKYFSAINAGLLYMNYGYARSFLTKGEGSLFYEVNPKDYISSNIRGFKNRLLDECTIILDTLGKVAKCSASHGKSEDNNNYKALIDLWNDANSLYALFISSFSIKVYDPHTLKEKIDAFHILSKPLIELIDKGIDHIESTR